MKLTSFSASLGLVYAFIGTLSFGEEIDLRLEISEPGVHTVPATAILDSDGPPSEPLLFSQLRLTWNRNSLPIWTHDENENGNLDAEDRITFLAPPSSMELSSTESYPTVFRLTNAGNSNEELRGMDRTALPADEHQKTPSLLLRAVFEEDNFRTGFIGSNADEGDHFYWLSASSLDEQPKTVIQFHDLPFHELVHRGKVNANFAFRGPTRIADSKLDIPDHSIEISVDGAPIRKQEWYGTFEKTWNVADLTFPHSESELAFRALERRTPDGEFLADIVFLNHVTITAIPRSPIPGNFAGQLLIATGLPKSDSSSRQVSLSDSASALYLETGERWIFPTGGGFYRIELEEISEEAYGYLLNSGEELVPKSIDHWPKPDLSDLTSGSTDSLLIAPEEFVDELEPLILQHRDRGLSPLVVSVEDLYHHYGSGVPSTESIRSAVNDWYERRKGNETRFLLLIGDASPEPAGQGRNRIPTYDLQTRGTLCASDNRYGCISENDEEPDIAVGRLPVATKEELRRLIEKLTTSASTTDTPQTSLECLWVVDHEGNNRDNAETLIAESEKGGVQSRTVFVEADETNEQRMARFRSELEKGPNVVFYCGHGARHYWRTGPMDYEKQSSLFSSDDLTELAKARPHPPARIVFTLTCDSAPFDHPSEDTLGERFLTVPQGGSLAFIGPSWKVRNEFNSIEAFSKAMLSAKTVGEAFLLTKHQLKSHQFTEAYNLLGDPTTPLR